MDPTLLHALTQLSPAYSLVARAEVYLTDTQAVALIFPKTKMERKTIELTAAEAEAIEKASGETVRNKNLAVWRGPKGETVFVDQVLGKHEFITFAVGVNAAGAVAGIEILEYRESYGQQVRGEEWRKQFQGKTKVDPLKVDKDIKNITGATLSSAHISAGVRRLLQTYDQVHARL